MATNLWDIYHHYEVRYADSCSDNGYSNDRSDEEDSEAASSVEGGFEEGSDDEDTSGPAVIDSAQSNTENESKAEDN